MTQQKLGLNILDKNMLDLKSRLNEFEIGISTTVVSDIEGKICDLEKTIENIINSLSKLKKNNLFIIGNGGSAGVASHASNDFINMCSLKSITFHDISILTCLTNDYGYDQAYKILIDKFCEYGDIMISISSSGNSKNIINASKQFKEKFPSNLLITLSGFDKSNSLSAIGDFNFWVNSKSYGIVEIAHQFILHNISDRLCLKK